MVLVRFLIGHWQTDEIFLDGASYINVMGKGIKALKIKSFTALTFIEDGFFWRVITDFEHMFEIGT